MSIVSPQWLYELHQDQICNILSQYDGPVNPVMLEEWIIEVSRTLCVNRDSRFRAEFQKILRRGAKVVLHGQIVNCRSPATQSHRPDVTAIHDNPRWFRERLCEPFDTRAIAPPRLGGSANVPTMHTEVGIQCRINTNTVSTDPSERHSARGQESSFSIEGLSDSPPPYTSATTLPTGRSSEAPPPYTPTVPIPTGDRFSSLPPFPDPYSNIVIAPGTFDDFTSEEIIDHYRPAITRMVYAAMGC